MYIFISHSSKEAAVAKALCSALENGGHSCFIAPRDIRSGYEYAEEIAGGIDSADAVLLLLSAASNSSPHVLREVERAVSRSIPILVYKLEEVALTKSMEYFLMTHQWMEAGRDSYADVVRCVNTLEQGKEVRAAQKVVASPSENRSNKKMIGAMTGIILGLIAIIAVLLVNLLSQRSGEDVAKENSVVTASPAPMEVKPGDIITMGCYNDEDIQWRVLKVSEDGSEAVVVSRDVLTMKAYDAAESGKFNHDGENNYYFSDVAGMLEEDVELQAYVQGSNSWENSNIRIWLNSDKENVEYIGQAPTAAAMPEGANAYSSEKGFLCSFTKEELARIKTTEVVTRGNVLSETETIVTQDKVFLLSMEELEWFEEANVSLLSVPTQGAIDKDGIYWYRDYCLGYGVEHMMWWLREPVEGTASKCYLIGNGYREENIFAEVVGVECYGIRPAMTIDLTAYSQPY